MRWMAAAAVCAVLCTAIAGARTSVERAKWATCGDESAITDAIPCDVAGTCGRRKQPIAAIHIALTVTSTFAPVSGPDRCAKILA